MNVVRMRASNFAPRETGSTETVQAAASSPGTRSIRSTEGRHWSADLVAPGLAGVVLHGTGGIGKSALAAELVARVGRLQPERLTTVASGEVSPDDILGGLAAALRRHPMAAAWDGARAAAVAAADRIDLPWDHRLALLRLHVLRQVPVLVGLDDFDDNLSAESGTWAVRDAALAGLLAGWAGEPHLGRLLITCRHPFGLPAGTAQALRWRHVGPLSRSGAIKLAMSLPALGQLDDDDLDRAWRLLAGHPRAMEYLDGLLGACEAKFPEVSRRLRAAIHGQTGQPVGRTGPEAPSGLSPAAAERIAQAAGDLLLGDLCRRLSTAAQALLTGVSVYREPVGCHALLLPGRPHAHGQRDRPAGPAALGAWPPSASDRAADGGPPQRTAHGLRAQVDRLRTAPPAGRGRARRRGDRRAPPGRRILAGAVTAAPQDRRAPLEASYHRLHAGDPAGQGPRAAGETMRTARRRVPGPARRLLRTGRWRLSLAGLAAAGRDRVGAPGRRGNRGVLPGHRSAGRYCGPAVRARPAGRRRCQSGGGRVAQQVTRTPSWPVTRRCAPRCRRTVWPGNLLVWRPSAADPLGSDVVMATAAVRSQFGSRLSGVYAPEVLASFGTGGLRIDVRAVAPYGAAANRATLAADVAARCAAGRQLLRNRGSRYRRGPGRAGRRQGRSPPADRAGVRGRGHTGAGHRLRARGPPGQRQRTAAGHAGGRPAPGNRPAADPRPRAHAAPAVPAGPGGNPGRTAGAPVLDIEFAAPSPVGLLGTQPALVTGRTLINSHTTRRAWSWPGGLQEGRADETLQKTFVRPRSRGWPRWMMAMLAR